MGLSWVDHLAGVEVERQKASSRYWLVSGFVISINGSWSLIVAGHVLADLQKCLSASSGRRELNSVKLVDGWHGSGTISHIPFAIDWNEIRFTDAEDDFGVVRLGQHYQRLLEANGVVALEAECFGIPPSDPDVTCLIGFPSQLIKVTTEEVSPTEARFQVCASMPILRVAIVDSDEAPPSADRVQAVVAFPSKVVQEHRGEVRFDDMDGMSGGPLFAVKRGDDGRYRYWLLGVQSSWRKREQIISACSTGKLLSLLKTI